MSAMKPQRGKTPKKRGKSPGSPDLIEPVEVYCRVRPLDNPGDPVCLKVASNDTVNLLSTESSLAFARTGQLKEVQYKFQHVFDEFTSQKNVFDHVSLPLVEDLVRGRNGLLFTYGITSSGKTYTMTGTPQDQGILPRCLDVLFNSIGEYQSKKYVFRPDKLNGFEVQSEADAMVERQKKDILPGLAPKTPGTTRKDKSDFVRDTGRMADPTKVADVDEDNTYAVFVSYIEIYNNYVYDLLEELPYDNITGYKPPQSKMLRNDASENMYVNNCTEVEVKSPEEAFEVLFKGQKRRKVAHTCLNAESSRSHSIFNIRLVQAPLDPSGQEVIQDNEKLCVSQLSLVDLAGSERTNRTKNQGDRLKEASNINQTLMALRTCLETLRENQKNPNAVKLVPYRDSKLTHLFKNYFDGDGRVRMVVCVNPKAEEYDETVHVMKFAEMSQEIMVQRSQQVKFDLGLAPGRRRLGERLMEERIQEERLREEKNKMEIETPSVPAPAMIYNLGPDFPSLQMIDHNDADTLNTLLAFLIERDSKRQALALDFEAKQDAFRARLVDFEQEHERLLDRNDELEELVGKTGGDVSKLEAKCSSLERKISALQAQLEDSERMRRECEAKLMDKNYKLKQEMTEKERLRDNFKQRLEINNIQWEENLEKERQKVAEELGAALEEKEKKFNMMKEVLDSETPVAKPRTFKTPGTAVKTRTYTTPGIIRSATSESDMSSIGLPNTRARTNTVSSAARPWGYGGGATTVKKPIPPPKTPVPSATQRSVPQHNLRHRRSRSNNETWLDHKPPGHLNLDTVLQPTLKKKRSVSKLEQKDTKLASKYMLTHQDVGSDGEFQTKYYKGDVIPTAGGGASVVFNDVEVHKQREPGTRKRRSSCPQPSDFDGEWTDPEERCAIAIEGHMRKRGRHTPESKV
ncbi:kinesin-like protein KIF23 isoform X2 [Dreissena polymorpha]|uniref:kinesin-like protein KIF23 isoform X2 n=1 Tax=Dreissena polymorpha TaxID=45954 RepID=UPI002264107B|nr:kinesin-like protein KIF23 isoform X2 [Dreissena polymorpha]